MKKRRRMKIKWLLLKYKRCKHIEDRIGVKLAILFYRGLYLEHKYFVKQRR